MTRQKSFKRLVRARAEKTGESYTAARAALLVASDDAKPSEGPKLTVSDDAIRDRTGRGWEEWFDLLDESGAAGQAPSRGRALAAGGARNRRLVRPVDHRELRASAGRPGRGREGGRPSRSQPRRPWPCRSSSCSMRLWTSRCALPGSLTASCASAPRTSPAAPASTGATAPPAWSWASSPRATPRARWAWPTRSCPTPRRPTV